MIDREGLKKGMDRTKQFYTTEELAYAPWFPYKTADSVRKLIENKKLKCINVSADATKKRYRIPVESVIEYFVNIQKY